MSHHTVRLDMLMMRSITSDIHFKYLDTLMTKWTRAIESMADESPLTLLWYVITFRYNKTAWYQVDAARKAYEEADRKFYELPLNTGLYWDDRQELDTKNNTGTQSI